MTLLTADSLKPLVANEIPASQVKDCRLLWFARIGPVNLASDCTEMNLWFSAVKFNAVKFNSLLVARAIPLICGSYLAVQDQTCVSAHTTKRKPHTATPKTDTESAATMWSENIPSNVSRTAGQRAKLSGFATLHGWSWTCVLKDKTLSNFLLEVVSCSARKDRVKSKTHTDVWSTTPVWSTVLAKQVLKSEAVSCAD